GVERAPGLRRRRRHGRPPAPPGRPARRRPGRAPARPRRGRVAGAAAAGGRGPGAAVALPGALRRRRRGPGPPRRPAGGHDARRPGPPDPARGERPGHLRQPRLDGLGGGPPPGRPRPRLAHGPQRPPPRGRQRHLGRRRRLLPGPVRHGLPRADRAAVVNMEPRGGLPAPPPNGDAPMSTTTEKLNGTYETHSPDATEQRSREAILRELLSPEGAPAEKTNGHA